MRHPASRSPRRKSQNLKARATARGKDLSDTESDVLFGESYRLQKEMARETITCPMDALVLLKAVEEHFVDGEATFQFQGPRLGDVRRRCEAHFGLCEEESIKVRSYDGWD